MYGRVTRVLAWILPIIQSGECGWIKDGRWSDSVHEKETEIATLKEAIEKLKAEHAVLIQGKV